MSVHNLREAKRSAAAERGRPAPRLADLVHAQVSRLILRGEFPKGLKLPSEAELATRFGVSRPVIRDALLRLRNEGYLRSQRGSGHVVVRGEEPGAMAFPPILTVSDLMRSYEFRVDVEAATASLAAERRTARNLSDLDATLARAADQLNRGVYHLLADLNFEFHRAVARATHNPFYLKTVEMIPNFVGIDRVDSTAFGGDDLPQRTQRIHTEHVAICEAIRRRDPERAAAEMQRHITAARDFVLERQAFTAAVAARSAS
ncbi:MAG TPA: FCD domain-containing protein [Casimicrobiaceae bacterium]|nr:FCD domain-containing protein [Casimicrobiaceae bacterium]